MATTYLDTGGDYFTAYTTTGDNSTTVSNNVYQSMNDWTYHYNGHANDLAPYWGDQIGGKPVKPQIGYGKVYNPIPIPPIDPATMEALQKVIKGNGTKLPKQVEKQAEKKVVPIKDEEIERYIDS